MLSKCRTCGTTKYRGDACPGCGAGLPKQTFIVRKAQPTGLAQAHFYHAPAAGVGSARARGDYRR